MTDALAASYAHCRRLTRRAGSNFYLGFLLLPRAKREAMHALYAFLRHTDDLGDGDAAASADPRALDEWQQALDRALAGQCEGQLFPALVDTVQRYQLQPEWLHAVIEGVRHDQHFTPLKTFGDLQDYSYHVAGVVGLCCVRIWGERVGLAPHERARIDELAVTCGLAFQVTNILRDIKEDAARGRVYLPQAELREFDYSADELSRGVFDERLKALLWFQIARTEKLYAEAIQLVPYLSPEGRAACTAMIDTYHELLRAIAQRDGNVFGRRVQVSTWRKLGIAARMAWSRATS